MCGTVYDGREGWPIQRRGFLEEDHGLVAGFNKEQWEQVARDVVYKGCYAKFTQNQDLKQALLATAGTTLVEASPEDRIWGIGLRKTDPRALNRATWRGTNWLGEILTKVREDLLNESFGGREDFADY